MNSDDTQSRFDRAIDFAVREMMQGEPRPHLRQRVLQRVQQRPKGIGWLPLSGLTAAAAMLALMFASTMDRSSEPQPVPPGQVAVQPSATPGALPPAPLAADERPEAVPAPQTPAARRSTEPAPEAIFGPRNQQVRAASTPAEKAVSAPPPATKDPGRPTNLTLTIAIVDQRDGATAPPKTVSMVVANRQWGRVRSTGDETLLNVDAFPEIMSDGRIRVQLTIEYRPARDPNGKQPVPTTTKTLTAIVENGKPLTVSQSADPSVNRAVRVDVTAVIRGS